MHHSLSDSVAALQQHRHVGDRTGPGARRQWTFPQAPCKKASGYNILRPEAVEAICMLYRITNDTIYRDWGWQIFEAFDKYSKVSSSATSSAKLQALKHDFLPLCACNTPPYHRRRNEAVPMQ